MAGALVLLHGFTGSPSSWDAVRAALPADVPVLAPALPGHAPDAAGAAAFEAGVDRLAALIRGSASTGGHPIPGSASAIGHVIAGYSMGARVALGLLVRHRDLFRRGVLIGCDPGLADAGERAARAAWERGWAELLESRGIDAFVDAWSQLPLWATQDAAPPDRLEAQDRVRRGHDPAALAAALRALGLAAMPDYSPRLHELDLPVTLVAGDRDAKFVRLAGSMRARLPRGRRLTAPGAGHNLLLERPEWVAELLYREWSE